MKRAKGILILLILLCACSDEHNLKRNTNKLGKELYHKYHHLSQPEQTFEHLWNVYNTYYAFFEEKEVDWQAVYSEYRPRITELTTEKELLNVFKDMLNPLLDGHVRLIKDGENAVQLDRRVCRFARKFNGKLKDFHNNTMTVLQNNGFNPPKDVFRIYDYEELGLDFLYHYTLSDRLGYLRIVDCRDHLVLFDDLLSRMENTKGLIIDLRYNLGGDVDKEMAGRFVKKQRVYGYKVQKGATGFSKHQPLTVKPQGHTYSQPVVLLVSDATFSAAEGFVLALSGENHVTIVGTSTGGYFSDVYNYRLPNGMNTYLSHQQYYTVDSVLLEDKGVTPDIRIENTLEDFHAGRDPLIDKAISLLNGQK